MGEHTTSFARAVTPSACRVHCIDDPSGALLVCGAMHARAQFPRLHELPPHSELPPRQAGDSRAASREHLISVTEHKHPRSAIAQRTGTVHR